MPTIQASCRASSSRNANHGKAAEILHERFSRFSQAALVVHKTANFYWKNTKVSLCNCGTQDCQKFLQPENFDAGKKLLNKHNWLIPNRLMKKWL